MCLKVKLMIGIPLLILAGAAAAQSASTGSGQAYPNRPIQLPDVIDRLATQGGNELVGSTPEQYAKLIREEIIKYAGIIKAAGIRSE